MLLAAPVQTDLRRRDRDPQLLGDVLVGQAVDVLEHDERPQPGRQLVERRREPAHELGVLGGQLRVQRHLGLHRVGDVVDVDGPLAAALAG